MTAAQAAPSVQRPKPSGVAKKGKARKREDSESNSREELYPEVRVYRYGGKWKADVPFSLFLGRPWIYLGVLGIFGCVLYIVNLAPDWSLLISGPLAFLGCAHCRVDYCGRWTDFGERQLGLNDVSYPFWMPPLEIGSILLVVAVSILWLARASEKKPLVADPAAAPAAAPPAAAGEVQTLLADLKSGQEARVAEGLKSFGRFTIGPNDVPAVSAALEALLDQPFLQDQIGAPCTSSQVLWLLQRYKAPDTPVNVARRLKASSAARRRYMLESLGMMKDPRTSGMMADLLPENSGEVIFALGRMGAAGEDGMIKALSFKNLPERGDVIGYFSLHGTAKALPALETVGKDEFGALGIQSAIGRIKSLKAP
jgi:hypothetical protein